MLSITRKMLDKNGLHKVRVTPGETQNWHRFHMWGYAPAIIANEDALARLGLISSHSFVFYRERASRFYGDWRSNGVDMLRLAKGTAGNKYEDLHYLFLIFDFGIKIK